VSRLWAHAEGRLILVLVGKVMRSDKDLGSDCAPAMITGLNGSEWERVVCLPVVELDE
jgi:hypothetical protein